MLKDYDANAPVRAGRSPLSVGTKDRPAHVAATVSRRHLWGETAMIESWRKVWRNGFAKVIDLDGLLALRRALMDDDQRLIQGATTSPPPLSCCRSWPAKSACAVGFCRLRGNNETVGDIETYFGEMCFESDSLIGEPGSCRHFLNWFDDTPRDIMRRELLAEVELAIREKELDRPSQASPARCLELTARAGWLGANHRLVAGDRPAR